MARRNLKFEEVKAYKNKLLLIIWKLIVPIVICRFFFAAIVLMAELLIEYVHAEYPRTTVALWCAAWQVLSFFAGGFLSLRRLKENKSWFDWVHYYFTCLTILLCYIELLQFCEVLKFEWFERVPTTVAAVI